MISYIVETPPLAIEAPICICCDEPLLIDQQLDFPGWRLRHRDWTMEIPYRVDDLGSSVRGLIRQGHQHAAFQLCGEIVELFRAYIV